MVPMRMAFAPGPAGRVADQRGLAGDASDIPLQVIGHPLNAGEIAGVHPQRNRTAILDDGEAVLAFDTFDEGASRAPRAGRPESEEEVQSTRDSGRFSYSWEG